MPYTSLTTVVSFLLLAWQSSAGIHTPEPDYMTDTLTVRPSPLTLSASFERNINTFLWDIAAGSVLHGTDWTLTLSDRFQRTLIRSGVESVKDQNTLNADAMYSLHDRLQLRSSFMSFVFSDNRTFGLNDLATSKILTGFSWLPVSHLSLTPMIGYSIDNQQGIRDDGGAYSAQLLLDNLRFGQTDLRAAMLMSAEYISPRYHYEHRGDAEFAANLSDDGANIAQFSFRETRREFHLRTSDTGTEEQSDIIESRVEQSFGLRDVLRYSILQSLSLTANVDISQRNISRDRNRHEPESPAPFFPTSISEFMLNGGAALEYDNRDGMTGRLQIEFNERDETHQIQSFEGADPTLLARQQRLEEQKNNSIHQSRLGLFFAFAPGVRDTLSLSASTVKMQYDTPSPENFDDRDELILLTGLRWAHRFSPEFLASLNADLAMRHTVYIFAQRSANNTWNRVLRLAPSSEWRVRQSFVSRNAAEIVANYTVYDFEEAVQGQRSFSLRQLSLIDTTDLRLTGPYWIGATMLLRWYERGELRWTAFTVRPLQFFHERTLTLTVRYAGERWELSAGLRYFEQLRYSYSGGVRAFSRRLRNYGPTARLRLPVTDNTGLLIDGWLQRTQEDGRTSRLTPNIVIETVWNL